MNIMYEYTKYVYIYLYIYIYIYTHTHKYTQYNKVKNSSNDEICISTFNITMNSREA